MPGGGHLTLRITRSEQSEQLLAAMVIETFICLGQQSPAAIEGIGLSATMSHRLVLDPPSALVELGVAQDVYKRQPVSQVGCRCSENAEVPA